MGPKIPELLRDARNVKLLRLLREDPRIGIAALARRVGLSPPATRERIQRLSESGIIQATRVERIAQRAGHLVAAARALRHLAPPVQADQREGGLGCRLAGAGKFVVEGVEGEQHLAPVRGREERGEKTIGVVAADERAERGQGGRHGAEVARNRRPCKLDATRHRP